MDCEKNIVHGFPLPRIQTGAMLGNGWLGLLVWGGCNRLNITIGCAGLWDHRGGMSWTPKQNYCDIRKALISSDSDEIRKIFSVDTEGVPGQPKRPSLIPVGRLVLTLPKNSELLRCEQRLNDALTRIVYMTGGEEHSAEIRLDMDDKGSFACCCNEFFDAELLPSYRLCAEAEKNPAYLLAEDGLAEISFAPPLEFSGNGCSCFAQPMPADDSFGVSFRREGNFIYGAFKRGKSAEALLESLKCATQAGWVALERGNREWWERYWQNVPVVILDNPHLEELYWHGLYKFGAMTTPDGVPAGLQGPWIEDDKMPPWSGDYHFNINIQMCYWPALQANHPEHLRRMFDMVWSWREQLRRNAECFVGIDDGYMLPHAVDDRCTCMGAFWAGTIDHACTAWIAQMMFDYCDYTGDVGYLKNVAFEFMRGTMRVFEAMICRNETELSLPISVSPEYRGADMNAWGANSSFQLASIHRLVANLIRAAEILGVPPDPFWLDVRNKLPQASIYVENGKPEIGLWDGLALEESHRHHSHLAGLCPFDTIDPEAPEWQEILVNSRERWTKLGMGEWDGWCLPWAAMLYNRFNNGDMAELILEIWKRNFTNKGGASLHDAAFKGFTIYADFRGEIMQMDGAMGTVAAIQDMLLHSRNGVLHIGAGVPTHWRNAEFVRMPAPGGFLVSAKFRLGKTLQITISATRDGLLKLMLPEPHMAWQLPAGATITDRTLECHLKEGETFTLFS